MSKAAKSEAAELPELATDECKCAHHRSAHSGKGEKKKCTARIFAGGALGDGKCDCTEFRRRYQ